ncbi:MAG: hypothetical protein ACK5BL_10205, partial [Flavobacteriales bacterium]
MMSSISLRRFYVLVAILIFANSAMIAQFGSGVLGSSTITSPGTIINQYTAVIDVVSSTSTIDV